MSGSPFKKQRNIFRIETGNTIGWQVRIERQKKKYSQFFSDSLHGGTETALERALQWRDEKLRALPERKIPTEHLHTRKNKRKAAEAMNRTGVIGIGFSMYTLKSGEKAPYVTCHWEDPETRKRRSSGYSINKHGLRGALRLACRRLREGQGQQPTKYQVEYLVRKATPAVKQLFAEATAEEHDRISA